MMRNDYRRSLILLRSNSGGYSGHVRLEKRTLTGSMSFLVQAPAAARLEAALVGSGRNGYYACPLGQLRRDGRGQAVLNASFDPRNLCARELDAYPIVAVVEVSAADCRVVLFGNVNGHSEIDWRQARTALCRLYRVEEDPPQSEIPPVQPEENVGEVPQAQSKENVGAILPPREPETTEEMLSESEEVQPRAGDLLNLDIELPWPDSVEALRQLFRENPPAKPAPDNGYVYVSAPMPEGSGYAEVLAGIRAENGAPVAVCYALPALWSVEPPAGLEEYRWSGDENRGWWIAEEDLRTGERL